MLLRYALPLICLTAVTNAYRGDDDDSRPERISGTNTTTSGTNTTSGSVSTGSSRCSSTMCISATVNATHVTYVMQSTGSRNLGWMGMGFGQSMARSPMVLAWTGSNGIILSQRIASRQVMPTVDSNPPRTATLENDLSLATGSQPKFAFSVPKDTTTNQRIIYAFGTTVPASSVDASIVQHTDFGTWQLDLAGTIDSGSASNPASSGSTSSGSSNSPLTSRQQKLAAHAILCAVGFLLFLPAGALLARYLRTFWPRWFTAHWIVQFGLAFPTIIAGVALGFSAGEGSGSDDGSPHKRWGVAILGIYFFQCLLGAIIHFIKPKQPSYRRHPAARRPLQNYFHAIIGIAIVGFALYQVRTGYKEEWPRASGRGDLPSGVNIVWHVWAVLLPVLYLLGLALLPRQFRQEAASSQKTVEDFEESHAINRLRSH